MVNCRDGKDQVNYRWWPQHDGAIDHRGHHVTDINYFYFLLVRVCFANYRGAPAERFETRRNWKSEPARLGNEEKSTEMLQNRRGRPCKILVLASGRSNVCRSPEAKGDNRR
jgi:hypothetical protein